MVRARTPRSGVHHHAVRPTACRPHGPPASWLVPAGTGSSRDGATTCVMSGIVPAATTRRRYGLCVGVGVGVGVGDCDGGGVGDPVWLGKMGGGVGGPVGDGDVVAVALGDCDGGPVGATVGVTSPWLVPTFAAGGKLSTGAPSN